MGKWKKRCEIAERQLLNAYDFFEKAEKRVDTLTGKVSWAVQQSDGKHNAVWTRDKENNRWLMTYEEVSE